ncbi:MAG: hypothetical protein RIQ81_2062 [Pseudomonadota bacterium]|jgi:hypothetical protein
MDHPSLFLGKCLQTPKQEPALIWPVKKTGLFFVVAAHPRKFGVFLLPEKPAGATAAGNLAAVCRTWGETLAVKAIWFDGTARAWWIPVGSNPENPRALIHLVGGATPEISLIEFEGQGGAGTLKPFIRMRLGTGGIFTKRRDFDGSLPCHLDAVSRSKTYRDILPELFSGEESQDPATSTGLLPLHQRDARDRIARRLKTLRKSLAQQEMRLPSLEEVAAARVQAMALQEKVTLSGGDGKSIDAAFQALKKKESGRRQAMMQVEAARKAVATAEAALIKLRSEALTELEVQRLVTDAGIAKAPKPPSKDRAGQQVAMDWMTFRTDEGVVLLVGKGAPENDRLVKAAAANDWWVHAVGVTGSHVVVPARQFKGSSAELPANVLRAAGILALHYSKNRANKAGEVYLTRRANLRKRKGDPPGLWQIGRSSSIMIRYSEDDLSAVLSGTRN